MGKVVGVTTGVVTTVTVGETKFGVGEGKTEGDGCVPVPVGVVSIHVPLAPFIVQVAVQPGVNVIVSTTRRARLSILPSHCAVVPFPDVQLLQAYRWQSIVIGEFEIFFIVVA